MESIIFCHPDHVKHLPPADEENMLKGRMYQLCCPGVQNPSSLAYTLKMVERCQLWGSVMPVNRCSFMKAILTKKG